MEPQVFNSISADKWTAIKAALVKQGYQVPSDSGRQSANGFTIEWSYDTAAQTLTVACLDSPWWAPDSTIQGEISNLIHAA